MFSRSSMPSTTSILSTYTAFTASTMLVRSVINEAQTMTKQLIPQKLQDKILLKFGRLLGNLSSQMTLTIEEYNGLSVNEIYEASEVYLRTRITPSIDRLKISKAPREKSICVTVNAGQKIIDIFEGIHLCWELTSVETQKPNVDCRAFPISNEKIEQKTIQLTFHKKYKDFVLSSYIPYVVKRWKAIKEENKAVKLYAHGSFNGDYSGPWSSINLDHPSTFDTLAMDPTVKKELMDDLDRFVRRKEFYGRVGKAWKRGYLLYGPPGTGKSSLIAAMANYLKFNVYDLELTTLHSNSELRRLLVSTTNQSILVIEDIDCSIDLQDRQFGRYQDTDNKMTLSGLLNFIDGLWSSCGDERIIVFTTNHKERLDPALLRPGRMDMHIHMSYCSPCGFKTLASNYLGLKTHCLFPQIQGLIKEVEVTPAEIAEELMKNEDANIGLERLLNFLETKKRKRNGKEDEVSKLGEDSSETEDRGVKLVKKKKTYAREEKCRS